MTSPTGRNEQKEVEQSEHVKAIAQIEPLVAQAYDPSHLRAVQLDLLSEFVRVCDALGLKYFAIAGTALGAVRHGGYIPWDDDLDLGMTREDFDTLIRETPKLLKSRYFMQHHSTDSLFPLPMAKLRREGSLFIEDSASSVSVHQGVFIDIFPLDRKPRSRGLQTIHAKTISSVTRMTRARSGYALRTKNKFASAAVYIARTALRMMPGGVLYSTQDRILRGSPRFTGPLTIAGGSYGYRREFFDPAWVTELKLIEFEGVDIPVFEEVEAYLARLYGDYMTLPPPEKRVSPHSPLVVSLPPMTGQGRSGEADDE